MGAAAKRLFNIQREVDVLSILFCKAGQVNPKQSNKIISKINI